jgi:hypothetical protein
MSGRDSGSGSPGGTGVLTGGGWVIGSGGCGTSGFDGCSIMMNAGATALPAPSYFLLLTSDFPGAA